MLLVDETIYYVLNFTYTLQDSNARPLQPINNRLVKLYIPLQDSNRLVQR